MAALMRILQKIYSVGELKDITIDRFVLQSTKQNC